MKRFTNALILLLLAVSSVTPQDPETPRDKMHRDFPTVQLIRPSLPAWHFNFDTKQWERDNQIDELPLETVEPFDFRLLNPGRKAKRVHHRQRSHRADHAQPHE